MATPQVNARAMRYHQADEKRRISAFRYFDKGSKGFIDRDSLIQLLSAMGHAPTPLQMKRIDFCIDTSKVSQRDFLNLMNSAVIKFTTNVKLLRDMFKLYNASRNNRVSSTPSPGEIVVDDDFLIKRDDWLKFTEEVIWEVDRQKHVYLAKMEPFLFCYIPNVLPDNVYEGTKIDYDAWIKNIEWPETQHLRTEKADILRSFKLFQITFNKMKYKHDARKGKYIVNDGECIAESDLEYYATIFMGDLSPAERDLFLRDMREFSTDGKINYADFLRKFINI